MLGRRVIRPHQRWSVIFLIGLVGFVGCTEDDSPPGEIERGKIERFWDKDLANISQVAADAKFSIGLGKYLKCLLGDLLNNDTNKKPGEWQTRLNLQCEFFKELDERGSLLFDQIKKARKEPSSFYSFQALEFDDVSPEGRVYQSYDIGLFLGIEPCQEFERRWRSMGLPTTDCMESKAKNTSDEIPPSLGLTNTKDLKGEQKKAIEILKQRLGVH